MKLLVCVVAVAAGMGLFTYGLVNSPLPWLAWVVLGASLTAGGLLFNPDRSGG